MNRIWYIFAIFLILSFKFFDSEIVVEGKSYDGLEINQSTVQDAIDKYGDFDTTNYGIACGTGGPGELRTHRYYFYKEEIIVHSHSRDIYPSSEGINGKIIEIGFFPQSKAITEKGLHIESAKTQQVIDLYGEPDKKRGKRIEFHYISKGISFQFNKDSTIRHMGIYEPGKTPYFFYKDIKRHITQ